ncbi:hypothetical protein [Legionella longbeachae]|uniref:Putative transmembrane protein n=1 Tax=Legionella longbeachae serogroup 1 (strain NSW150) TaxID=661367 RepID=D3HQT9_LEGLN|nr:hypothetical protein [Legionella longbeachae]VEE01774.1 transmembrane protein [Legionella oakridgensis]HBD7396526.1 hypothetical protein [Legionella pneumophila]ARB91899.1 hypothetical protein A6J40_06780 [Legionella longbeachae]ARM34917.1 hypothetical protein B0B39_15940 [Legionella longbeachae]EEZ95627.1 hypothetical protein LLB_0806 [Legionella longbeachae D-4968]
MFARVHYEPKNKGTQGYVHRHHHSHHGRYHRHYYNTSGWGFGSLLIGAMIVTPIILIALILKLTVGAFHFATTSMTAAGFVGAKMGISAGIGAGVSATTGSGVVMGSTLAFSTALGIGALLVYGTIGMLYLYFSAKECYINNHNAFHMFKSQVVNEDGLSFTGAIKSIGAILWSPFLLIGGLAGMGARAVAQTFNSRFSQSKEEEEIELEEIKTSHSQMKNLGLKNTQNTNLGQNPIQKASLFYDPSTEEQFNRFNPMPTQTQLRCN